MEPQVDLLAEAIRKEQAKVRELHELWREEVENLGYAQMPATLLSEMAYRDGLKEAWQIVTGKDWPED